LRGLDALKCLGAFASLLMVVMLDRRRAPSATLYLANYGEETLTGWPGDFANA